MRLAEVTLAEALPKGVRREGGSFEKERQGKALRLQGGREKGGPGCSQVHGPGARVQVRETFSLVCEKALGL